MTRVGVRAGSATAPPHFLDALEAIVAVHGARIAIEDERGSLSYDDLWQQAGNVASRLLDRGIEGQIIGVQLPRSREAIIALLGIWRANAVYLPIDPIWPADRIAFVRRDAECTVVIDASWDFTVAAGQPTRGDAPARRHLHDPAYVIYTSGSTGSPKGVVVSHRGLVPVLSAQIRALGLRASKRCVLILSTAFDASLSDIGTCLLSGATLVLEPGELARDPAALVETLERRRITHVDLPPSLLPKIDPATLPSTLEQIIVGGEICPAANLRAWARCVRVLVAYGPTEATICTSMVSVDPETWSRPLIGTPLPGVAYDIVDGELLIAGDQLAIGYHERPDLDQERFIVRHGRRWYRTGDRVVTHSATEIEFVGRVDRQIKVRGVLVAPEEIETCLAAHPNIKRAAVVHRALSSNQARGLVAFIETDEHVEDSDLRAHLRASLPRVLWPQRFERMSSLPQTSSGKIDLEQLTQSVLSLRKHDPPRGATEVILAACFAEVLVGARSQSTTPLEIYRDDDFFALGGDSFATLELIVAAQSRGLILPTNAVYEHPTPAALARSLCEPTATEGMPASALRTEARIASHQQVSPNTNQGRGSLGAGRDLFITGATGFLGARVLAHLIDRDFDRGDRKIHCLVRAANEEEGRRRLAALIGADKLANVSVVCGDITKARFGLPLEQWQSLSASTSEVFHLAAAVDMVRSFADLRAANLDGTAHAIQFALDGATADGTTKRMHYASTLSVFVGTERHEGLLREGDDLRDTRTVFGGYAQTKWAAEVAVRAACGDNATIHRLGLLTANAHAPFIAPAGCQLIMFLRGLLELGCLPDTNDLHAWAALDVTPVDYAARAFVEIATQMTTTNAKTKKRTFHIANPTSLTLGQIAAAIERRRNIRLERVPPDEIVRRASATPLSPTKAAVLLSLARRLDPQGNLHHRSTDLFLATNANFDTARTQRELEQVGIICPPPSAILDAHLDHLMNANANVEAEAKAETRP